MLDARLNIARVEQRHAELSRAAACRRCAVAEEGERCAELVPARRVHLRRRRTSLRLRLAAALWRG